MAAIKIMKLTMEFAAWITAVGAAFVLLRKGYFQLVKWRNEQSKEIAMTAATQVINQINEKLSTVHDLGSEIKASQTVLMNGLDMARNDILFISTTLKESMNHTGIYWVKTDSMGNTIEVGEEMSRRLGLTESEQKGENWLNRVPEEYHESIRYKWTHSIAGNMNYEGGYPLKTGNKLGNGKYEYVWLDAKAKKAGENWIIFFTITTYVYEKSAKVA